MKLGSLKEGGRDGTLIVVSRDLATAVRASGVAPTLQAALDDWSRAAPRLNALSEALNAGRADGVFALDFAALAAPLPRAYEFVDGSAYLPHVERVRRARGAEVPESFYTDPLMYQATSAGFYGPRDPILAASEEWGIDLEAEVVVVTDDVPMGVTARDAERHIQLVGLINDVSLRNLIPPSSPRASVSCSPSRARRCRRCWRRRTSSAMHGAMRSCISRCARGSTARWFGEAEAGVDMQFSFAELVAHAAKTRPLAAGTIVGSGTIANQDTAKGASCLAEQRTVETLRDGKPSTPFLKFGDRVQIDVTDANGASLFGAIEQTVAKYESR